MKSVKRFIPNSIKDVGQLFLAVAAFYMVWDLVYGGEMLVRNNQVPSIADAIMLRLMFLALPIGIFLSTAVMATGSYLYRKYDPVAYELANEKDYGF